MRSFFSKSLFILITLLSFKPANAKIIELGKPYEHFSQGLCAIALTGAYPNPKDIDFKRVQDFEAGVNAADLEREYAIKNLFINAIAKENVILLGGPGVAKSKLASDFFSNIVDENGNPSYFARLMGSETNFSDLQGPIDWNLLNEKNVYRRVTQEGLLMYHFAFLDELFNIRMGALGHLLKALNERQIDEGGVITKGILKTTVAATNGTNSDFITRAMRDPSFTGNIEMVKAFFDRFGSMVFIQKAMTEESMDAIIQKRIGKVPVKLPLSQMLALQDLATTVVIPTSVSRMITLLADTLEQRFLQIEAEDQAQALISRKTNKEFLPYYPTKIASPRTKGKAGTFLQAYVVYDWVQKNGNRSLVANVDDLKALRNFFCLVGPETITAKAKATADLREAYHFRVLEEIERPAFDQEFMSLQDSISTSREKSASTMNRMEKNVILKMTQGEKPEFSKEEALEKLPALLKNSETEVIKTIQGTIASKDMVDIDAYEQAVQLRAEIEHTIAQLKGQPFSLDNYKQSVFDTVLEQLPKNQEPVTEGNSLATENNPTYSDEEEKVRQSFLKIREAEAQKLAAQKALEKLNSQKEAEEKISEDIANTTASAATNPFDVDGIDSKRALSGKGSNGELYFYVHGTNPPKFSIVETQIAHLKHIALNPVGVPAGKTLEEALTIAKADDQGLLVFSKNQMLRVDPNNNEKNTAMGPKPTKLYRAAVTANGDKVYVFDKEFSRITVLNTRSGQVLNKIDLRALATESLNAAVETTATSQNNDFAIASDVQIAQQTLFYVAKDESGIFFTKAANDELFFLDLKNKDEPKITSVISLKNSEKPMQFSPLFLDRENDVLYTYAQNAKENSFIIGEIRLLKPNESKVYWIQSPTLSTAEIDSALVLEKSKFPGMLAALSGNVMAISYANTVTNNVALVDLGKDQLITENATGSMFTAGDMKSAKNLKLVSVVAHPAEDHVYGILVRKGKYLHLRFPVNP